VPAQEKGSNELQGPSTPLLGGAVVIVMATEGPLRTGSVHELRGRFPWMQIGGYPGEFPARGHTNQGKSRANREVVRIAWTAESVLLSMAEVFEKASKRGNMAEGHLLLIV
jgi:hypothetical protein